MCYLRHIYHLGIIQNSFEMITLQKENKDFHFRFQMFRVLSL